MIQCLNDWHGERASLYHGDCVEVLRQMPSGWADLAVFSPPFADLFTYSDSVRDMGNVTDDAMFLDSYRFVAEEVGRSLRPGRNAVVHCADLPSFLWKTGRKGMRDFPGLLIRAHEDAGLWYAGRVTIWKDPVTEMQRTKAERLLYKNIRENAERCSVGNPDYLLIFHKDGRGDDDRIAVRHDPAEFPVELWQEWASPVWMTINQTNTLNVRGAREEADGRHMCPLQLDVIERAVRLWTNPGEVVLSPFAGIGSEGVRSLELGRRFVGVELKESYWQTACVNLADVDEPRQASLFGASAK
jgi:DNA modification methylase